MNRLAIAVCLTGVLWRPIDANAAADDVTPCEKVWQKLDLHEGSLFSQYYQAWKALQSSDDFKGASITLPDGAKRVVVTRSAYGSVEKWTFHRASGELIPQGSDSEGVLVTCEPPDAKVVNWKALDSAIAPRVKLQCRLSTTTGKDPLAKWLVLALSVGRDEGSVTILSSIEGRAGKATRCSLSQ